MDLLNHVRRALDAAGLGGDLRLAVAFSGGLDSTALLLLATEALGPQRVLAIHVDHGVHDDSHLHASHCQRVADELGIACAVRTLSPALTRAMRSEHGGEGGLRELRYSALCEVCRDRGITFLATAHHADDAVETHLLAMARGSGLTGLAGPRKERALGSRIRLVRPLWEVDRAQLDTYLTAHHAAVPTVVDPTNKDLRIARNRIRHDVIPVLREVAGSEAPLKRSVQMLWQDRADLEWLLERRMAELGLLTEADSLDFSGVGTLADPAVTAAIRRFLAERGPGMPPTSELVARILEALGDFGRTRWIDAPGLRLRVEAGVLTDTSAANRSPIAPISARAIPLGTDIDSHDLGVSIHAELCPPPPTDAGAQMSGDREVYFDLDALGGEAALSNLALRAARPGDRFRPFGLGGSVRLRRWLAGRGIPRSARPLVAVVVLGGRIIWVVFLRRGAVAPISNSTVRCLRLSARAIDD